MLHLTKHSFYELHTNIIWLTSFSGEMVIYAFLLGFSSPSHKKGWFKIWKIKDQPNHINYIKESQISHCLVVHKDAHQSNKRYKVEKLCLKGHPRYTSTNIHKHTPFFVFFKFFYFLWGKKNIKQSSKTNTIKHQKLDWLKTQQTIMHKTKNVIESLGIFFLPNRRFRGRSFLLYKPLFRWIRKRVEIVEV